MSFPIDGTIPNAPNDPADDQPIMKSNFNNIKGFLTVDHVAPGTVNAGFHSQVHINTNQAAPGLSGAVGVLFANTGTTSYSQPFWQNASVINQLWSGVSSQNASGYIKIGNIMIQWGTNNILGGANTPVSFAPSFSATVYSVVSNIISAGATSTSNCHNFSNAGFNIKNNSSTQNINWIAIGPCNG